MKNKISFAELMQQNGFQHLGKTTYDGRFIYEREWRKTTDLAWYGEKESTYRIEGYESYGTPIIRLYENGRPLGTRDYSSPKRAIAARRSPSGLLSQPSPFSSRKRRAISRISSP